VPPREDALALLHEHTRTDSLRRHGLAVEAVMREVARRRGEDRELWGITGLLHDFDYEAHPDDHPRWGRPVLEAQGYPEAVVRAIQAHATHGDVPRDTDLARWLFACDELTGFVYAVALVQPNREVDRVTPASVRKKLKDRSFARSVSREDIALGTAELGVDLEELVPIIVAALAGASRDLGLSCGQGWSSADGAPAEG
jgi:putative nucleotidyltransferase with HDIG domain